jgi:hypothetical protein
LLKALVDAYTQNQIMIKFRNKLSKLVEINKGVRQDYPLSPISSVPPAYVILPMEQSYWQKESWQTVEETSGHVRPEWANKWPKSMTDI